MNYKKYSIYLFVLAALLFGVSYIVFLVTVDTSPVLVNSMLAVSGEEPIIEPILFGLGTISLVLAIIFLVKHLIEKKK